MANVHFEGRLPDGIGIMNPYRESADIRLICESFYRKYYNDHKPRTLILGINPGRLGAGATGIPFTDTKRLNCHCGIIWEKFSTHEPSSVFMYTMIDAYGGPEKFYGDFYINSVFPLCFVKSEAGKKAVNYNYYDSPALEQAVRPLILQNLQKQIEIAGKNEICFCLGSGKNYKYLADLNDKFHFFNRIIPLEHPRFIMQYKLRSMDLYIADYIDKLHSGA